MKKRMLVVTTGTLLALASRAEASDARSDVVADRAQRAEALRASTTGEARSAVMTDVPATGEDVRTAGPANAPASAAPAMASPPASATPASTTPQERPTAPADPWTGDHGG